ncbi:MAG: ribonuclease Y [Kiritimatiellae bacterium]|nr:ribonuclease Y [Kiritimatiellia bacterium]
MLFAPPFFALTSSTWDNLSDGASLLIVALFIIAGIFLGYALRGLVGRWQAESIERKMKLREDEAEAEIKARIKEGDIQARAAVVKAREEFEASTKKRRAELQAVEDRQTQREANLDRKAAALDVRENAVSEKATAAEHAAEEARLAAAAAAATQKKVDEQLCGLAKMTHEEARKEVLRLANEALRADAESLSRRIQEAAREQGDIVARRLVADAVQRCAVSHLAEIVTTVVKVPGAEMKGRIIGRDGRNVRAFEAATGVSLLLDDAPETVVLSSFDPLRREVARLALESLMADGRIHPASIETAVEEARKRVSQTELEVGTAAAAEAGVLGLPDAVLRRMGALKYRTSFSQNVLRHSVEVALVMGTMAAEMKLDAAQARRVGFLHDIGKAVTGEKKGAHAALGAEFLAAQGEDAVICAAVAAHHAEGDSDGGVLGVLCAAADAISSARPGARLENVADYVQRLEDLEKLAKAHAGVTGVFAVQAGRDLRIMVDPACISDVEANALARDLCREISERIRFPGQIRVTVVRELRCTEYAK